MSRRSTPERLSNARRAATLARLISSGELPDRAEAKIVAWEAMTSGDGRPRDGAYWEAAWAWIQIQRGNAKAADPEP
jgi:hypothetical protein